MISLRFSCLKCGSDQLNEVMQDVTVTLPIDDIHVDDPSGIGCDYGDPMAFSGRWSRHFQCSKCGQVVMNGATVVQSYEDLVTWLTKFHMFKRGEDSPV